MNPRCPHITARRNGFTLIEILIGVIVLSLGLLGLAAVFPVVVREQRIATEQTLGAAATDAAIADVLGNDTLRPNDTLTADTGWELVAAELAAVRQDAIDDQSNAYQASDPWYVPGVSDDGFNDFTLSFRTGGAVDAANYAELDLVTNAMGDEYPFYRRLIPAPFTEGSEPRFVWDAVFRASPNATSGTPSSIQVAMFIRPIDQNIRVPRRARGFDEREREQRQPMSLSDVLGWPVLNDPEDNGLVDAERRLPVVVDDKGRPTRDGDATKRNRYYSLPYIATVDIDATNSATERRGSLLVIDTSTDLLTQRNVDIDDPMPFIRVVGQKLLGDDGRVYEVVGIPEEPANGVIVTPPLRTAFFAGNGEPSNRPFNRPTRVVFTPQVPVEVRVFEVPVR